jgi:hypothetical protein
VTAANPRQLHPFFVEMAVEAEKGGRRTWQKNLALPSSNYRLRRLKKSLINTVIKKQDHVKADEENVLSVNKVLRVPYMVRGLTQTGSQQISGMLRKSVSQSFNGAYEKRFEAL